MYNVRMNETQHIYADAPRRKGEGERVALGMSGGVDSSVAATLLMDEGYEVLGVTCVFVDTPQAWEAAEDAKAVAERIGIELVVRDCTELFSREVVCPFVEAYAAGLTPSPCVGCNVSCKIPSLIDAAEEYGCAFVATGHYARVVERDGRFAAAVAADAVKDQSYMLSMLTQAQLSRLLLPLGGIEGGKPQVRRIAEERGLPTASKSDSQDICFIQGSHIPFLEEHGAESTPGDIVNADGVVVGRHEGLIRYTVGQRKGIGVGGTPEPYYVLEKQSEENRLIVGFAAEARMTSAVVGELNWQGISGEEFGGLVREEGISCMVKLRYRQRAVPCSATMYAPDASCADGMCGMVLPDEDELTVILDEPQSLTAPGQYAVLYAGDAVMAAGVIKNVIRVS